MRSLAFVLLLALSPAFAREAVVAPPVLEAAFTPEEDAAGLIVRRIGAARSTVQVQAYLFTNRAIANALLAARKRGVAVEVIGDAAQHAAGGLPVLKALDRAGVAVYLDGAFAAAHDKVVIVDGKGEHPVVITGSFNFTVAAQEKNSENVLAVSGDRVLAARYVAHFERRRALSTPWK
jgi:phosphatidylserine/phosphatidylglycerophosphate/cardiolipin synthase-like enzyme